MYSSGDQLFASSRLAGYEHRRGSHCYRLNHLVNSLHLRRAAYDVVERVALAELTLEQDVFLPKVLLFEHLSNRHLQLFDVEARIFDNQVLRPKLEGPPRRVHRRESGDHYDHRPG